MNPIEEITFRRPTVYSLWHRQALPAWCKVTDGDWFEQREKEGEFKTVAYIETIQVPDDSVKEAHKKYKPWPSKESLLYEIQQK